MTRVYGKNGKFDLRKYKMHKDIQTPPRIYDYVAELSCCAQFEQNRLTQFCWGNRGSLSFFTHTQSISQTNLFISPTDYKYGRIWNIYGSKRVISRPDVPFCGYRWWQIMFRDPNPPETHVWDHSMQNLLERALRKSHVNGATMLKLYSYIGMGKYLGACQNFSVRGRP